MKHFLISLLLLSSLTSQAQNKGSNQGNGSGAALAAGAVAVAVGIDKIQESLELFGTEYILGNYPEIEEFTLKLNSKKGIKTTDFSGVGLLTFNVSLGATKEKGQERFVLAAFFTPGFISSYGIDYSKVNFVKWDKSTWNSMISVYIGLASGFEIINPKYVPVYISTSKGNAEISIVNVKGKMFHFKASDKTIPINKVILKNDGVYYIHKNSNGFNEEQRAMPYRILKGDSYVVSDFSDDYIIVYNEKSLGLYSKNTASLVQLETMLLYDIHKFVNHY